MRALGLDGRWHNWKLTGHAPLLSEEEKSSYHLRARALLREVFPMDLLLEEVPIPGSLLHADFFLPTRRLMVEVQGEQHERLCLFFHGSLAGFLASRARDESKRVFCRQNRLRLVELPHDGDNWRELLEGA